MGGALLGAALEQLDADGLEIVTLWVFEGNHEGRRFYERHGFTATGRRGWSRTGVVVTEPGAEAITGSTRMKAATAQKLVLNSFSTAVMVRTGRTWSNLMVDFVPTNAKLRGRATGLDDATCEEALVAGGQRDQDRTRDAAVGAERRRRPRRAEPGRRGRVARAHRPRPGLKGTFLHTPGLPAAV